MTNTTAATAKLATLSRLTDACRLATRGFDRVQAVVLGPVGTFWVTTWHVAHRLEAQGYEVMAPIEAATVAAQ